MITHISSSYFDRCFPHISGSLTFSFPAYHHDTTKYHRYSRIPEDCFGCPLDKSQFEGCFNPQTWNFAPFEEKEEHTVILQRDQVMSYPCDLFYERREVARAKVSAPADNIVATE